MDPRLTAKEQTRQWMRPYVPMRQLSQLAIKVPPGDPYALRSPPKGPASRWLKPFWPPSAAPSQWQHRSRQWMPIRFLLSGAGMASLPLSRTFNEEMAGRAGTTSVHDSCPAARRCLHPAHTSQACNTICVIGRTAAHSLLAA